MRRFASIFCVTTIACGAATTTIDDKDAGGMSPDPDAGMVGATDAGSPDAGSAPDAATPDAGSPDSGSRDAGSRDAGTNTRPTPDDCITDVAPGQRAFDCDGLTFHVSIPPACENAGCGLILDVHGLSMSGPMEENNTNLAALTASLDYVVVQPSATPRPPLSSWSFSVDDDKVFGFLQRAMRVFVVDDGRVHFTGFSQGGYMTWRMLCAHADVFASVAPAAGSGYCGDTPGCNFTGGNLPSRETSILYMHGMRDALVAFSCGEQQIDAVVAAWSMRSDGTVSMDAEHHYQRYTNDNGTIVENIEHDYISSATSNIPLVPDLVGHCYPGSTDPGDERGQLYSFKCDGTNAFHWGETVLDFFQRTAR